MSVTRNKCHNDLAHVLKSTWNMCSAISLALVNSRTGSHILVISLQTLPPRPDTERDWYWRIECRWLARLYFSVLLLGNNRSTTCDSVLLLICGHKGIASKAMDATSMMRAITVIWCYFITCYSQTWPFIRRGGRVWVRHYIQVVPTDCNYAWVISD